MMTSPLERLEGTLDVDDRRVSDLISACRTVAEQIGVVAT